MLSRSVITHHYSFDYMHIGGDKTSKSAIFATFGVTLTLTLDRVIRHIQCCCQGLETRGQGQGQGLGPALIQTCNNTTQSKNVMSLSYIVVVMSQISNGLGIRDSYGLLAIECRLQQSNLSKHIINLN